MHQYGSLLTVWMFTVWVFTTCGIDPFFGLGQAPLIFAQFLIVAIVNERNFSLS